MLRPVRPPTTISMTINKLKVGDVVVRKVHKKERYLVTKINDETIYARSLNPRLNNIWEFWKKDIMKEKIK